jgi:hypothetical protein
MSNKEELAEDEVEVDSSSNETDEEFSDEQLFTPPTGEEALQVYLEDKYLVKLTTYEKLRDTNKEYPYSLLYDKGSTLHFL